MTSAVQTLIEVQQTRDAIDELSELCAKAFSVPPADMRGRDRHKRHVEARALFCRIQPDRA